MCDGIFAEPLQADPLVPVGVFQGSHCTAGEMQVPGGKGKLWAPLPTLPCLAPLMRVRTQAGIYLILSMLLCGFRPSAVGQR